MNALRFLHATESPRNVKTINGAVWRRGCLTAVFCAVLPKCGFCPPDPIVGCLDRPMCNDAGLRSILWQIVRKRVAALVRKDEN